MVLVLHVLALNVYNTSSDITLITLDLTLLFVINFNFQTSFVNIINKKRGF